jgi:hypothetical protein
MFARRAAARLLRVCGEPRHRYNGKEGQLDSGDSAGVDHADERRRNVG